MVVFPASGCEMMAKVRRRCISASNSDMLMIIKSYKKAADYSAFLLISMLAILSATMPG
jgi:hypothetical protein